MQIFRGTTAHGGAVFGIIKEYKNASDNSSSGSDNVTIDDAALKKERFRFLRARVNVDLKLKELSKKAKEEMGKEVSDVFEGTRVFLRDGSFIGEILDLISDKHASAEKAVETIGNRYAEEFANLPDEYMRARSEDILEVKRMILEALKKALPNTEQESDNDGAESIIVLADTLSAAELIELDFKKVKGIILRHGSTLSHAAILAHSKSVPMIVCCNIQEGNGHQAVINGDSGIVYVDPDRATLKEFGQRKLSDVFVDSGKNYRIVDKDSRVKYFVNVGNALDVDKAIHFGAEGIGLFRSEFLYFGRKQAPEEEELLKHFKEALMKMGSKRVVVRTIDFGADKIPGYVHMDVQDRGLSFSLKERKLLKTELRALYRASIYGNLLIMFPMVRNTGELREVKSLISEVKRELLAEHKEFKKDMKQGIMVETLEAVSNIEALAKEADFFSIGTNDLSHFVLGIEREDFVAGDLTKDQHDRLLSAIKTIAEAGKKAAIHVSICGELASNPKWADEFVNLGVTSLSVSI